MTLNIKNLIASYAHHKIDRQGIRSLFDLNQLHVKEFLDNCQEHKDDPASCEYMC